MCNFDWYRGRSIKSQSKIIRNQEIYLQQKINHSFSKYLPLDNMQWSHHSTHFSKQVEKPFTGSYFKESCTAEITLEFIFNFLPQSFSFYVRKVRNYMVWNLDCKEVVALFNIAFFKILLNRNSNIILM